MNPDSTDVHSRDRRRFLMLMGLAAATTALSQPVAAIADPQPMAPAASNATAATAASGAPATPVTPAAAAEPKPPSAEAMALAQLVRIRYPEALSDAQLKGLTEELDSRLESGRVLRKQAFANADEPDLTFHA